jgi:hypothetical protein
MALNLQVANAVTSAAQPVTDQSGNATALALSTGNVGIGTTNPTQALTLGSGNMSLPYGVGALDGNLFLGGNTDAGQVGLRLFAIDAAGEFQCGFIDVRAGTVTDGLRIRVDTDRGGIEQMRITAGGLVGIGTQAPSQRLDVNGNILVQGNAVVTGALDVDGIDILATIKDIIYALNNPPPPEPTPPSGPTPGGTTSGAIVALKKSVPAR